MTLKLELDLDIMVTYLHPENEVKWFKTYGLETLKNFMLFDVCNLDLMTLILK